MRTKTLLIIAALSALSAVQTSAAPRTWTSIDGDTIDAELVSATETTVTIRRAADGRRFDLPLERLSEADRQWVAAQSGAAGDLHPLPKEVAILVAERGTVLFEDDFNREDSAETDDLGEAWETNSKSRAQGAKQNDLVDGTLVMTISEKADHAISTNTTVASFNAAVAYVRMKLEDGESLKLAFNDRSYAPVHAGHINGVTITPEKITLDDEREGRFGPVVYPMKDDPSKKDEIAAIIAATSKTFDLELKTGEWHDVVTLHDGETLSTWIDGEQVATFTSPGFAHPTKSMLAFAVPVRATVDNFKLWKLE